MPLDAICLSALVAELNGAVQYSRIEKIHQPARDELLFSLRGTDGAKRLLLSASPTRPRAQLTDLPRENPQQPPMFCMLLRKHLAGGRILSVTQPLLERLIEFEIEATDELGEKTRRRLVLEVMGRHANVILVDSENRIVDCLRRVDQDMSAQRQILPGMFYRLPPEQGKQNPFTVIENSEGAGLFATENESKIEKHLVENFQGISPLIARELAFEATGASDAPLQGNEEKLTAKFQRLMKQIAAGAMSPYLLYRDEKPVDFSFRPILQYGPNTQSQKVESFSQLLDTFYAQKETSERLRQKSQDLGKTVTNARDRLQRKLLLQKKELEGTKDREALREIGDIITSNLYAMEKGMTQLKTINFYDPDSSEIAIKLDPLLTPQQNAARYYKDYNRAKRAEEMLTGQIEKGSGELEYLISVQDSLQRAGGESDLEDIRQELVETGYIRRAGKAKGRMKRPAAKPLEFRSTTGFRISVGRNNTQNDLLTTKLAGKGDIWLHTQKIHGSHVILWTEGKTPDAESITQAATLAAYYSQGRDGGKIPVDYTSVKFVKKPAAARPGMVIYTTYETILVAPEESLVQSLQEKTK